MNGSILDDGSLAINVTDEVWARLVGKDPIHDGYQRATPLGVAVFDRVRDGDPIEAALSDLLPCYDIAGQPQMVM